ncbi:MULTISPECIES: hypothetical protein [unclassified Microbacterium]|uniref:hypothetical protein n=1 Tax=unclassified Microbacterium TaxID=2609290 RepID=UPI000EA9C93B|nr:MULTISPECIES: hypothetical protein [unclassified Microbacterium]MBT2484837.1 hypothetical protein [Microbacterium sp. ISL-108]RKN67707.1 hypothetical protein D7252_08970 [Microbacterium sp. CGR2]
MNDETMPLPVYPWPISEARMALLREAKARIDIPIRVVPVEAAHGSPGRVLCFGLTPPFMCKTAPIAPQNVLSVDSIENALRFWLNPFSDERQFDEAHWMSNVMGCDVTLVAEEDHTGKVRFDV